MTSLDVTQAEWDAFRAECQAHWQRVEELLARLNEGPEERLRRLRDEEVAKSSHPDRDRYVFLLITWGAGGEDERETFGPYVVQADGSHLDEIAEKAKSWPAGHPDRLGATAHLFATTPVPPGGSPDLEAVP